MSQSANPYRGEASLPIAVRRADGRAGDLLPRLLRPSFAALVAAEEELGPLFALVERAGAGQLKLSELAALFWHCLVEREGLTREALGEAIAGLGLAAATRPLKILLGQILQGAADADAE